MAMLDALFPSACAGCGRGGSAFCPDCVERGCPGRRLWTGGLDVRAAGSYAGGLRHAVLAYKRGRRDVGDALAAVLADRLLAEVPRNAVLVPVPTVAWRRRERGFDQGIRLAERAGERAGRTVLVALRQAAGDSQRGRNRSARLRARERFVCAAPDLVAEMQVVLVDDVVTTGATLRDCAAVLRRHGARVAHAAVVACA